MIILVWSLALCLSFLICKIFLHRYCKTRYKIQQYCKQTNLFFFFFFSSHIHVIKFNTLLFRLYINWITGAKWFCYEHVMKPVDKCILLCWLLIRVCYSRKFFLGYIALFILTCSYDYHPFLLILVFQSDHNHYPFILSQPTFTTVISLRRPYPKLSNTQPY